MDDVSNWLDLMQWPALIVTVIAAWLVASSRKSRREIGFWFFMLSNVLWVLWGIHTDAFALIALQFFLAVSNCRGLIKNRG
jgi:hypothetical protein